MAPTIIKHNSSGLAIGMREEFLHAPVLNIPAGAISLKRTIRCDSLLAVEVVLSGGIVKKFQTILMDDKSIKLLDAFEITRTEIL